MKSKQELDDRWLTVEEICAYLSVPMRRYINGLSISRCPVIAWAVVGCSKSLRWTAG